jgi:ATP-dependent DNA helicase RecG
MASAHESEVIEFKDRKTLKKDEMGEYFSALSNEANLKNRNAGWIIFGITDDGKIVNSDYLDTPESQNKLKMYISEQTSNRMSYIDIHTKIVNGNRVILFEIPPAAFGIPTAFKGFAYERQGESRVPLSDSKRLRIMEESIPDWSARIILNVNVEALDSKAISVARDYFIRNRPTKEAECRSWDDITFLNKIGLTLEGMITYAALILLGKEDYSHLMPDIATKMRWILRDKDRNTIDNEFFSIPFILAIDDLCAKIRNVKYEYFRPNTIIPDRMDTYEPAMMREALNNCIAHQDYRMCEYITVVEYDRDRLVFRNAGSFIPGSLDMVLKTNSPASYYRNRCLASAMSNLGMMDAAGGGIIRMFGFQRARFFPMPEYDISSDHVEVTITGKVIDKAFADILMRNPDFDLSDVILLDKVQKRKSISDPDANYLRTRGLIGGRKPNYILSTSLAGSTDDSQLKGKAIKDKGFEDKYYEDLVLKFIGEYSKASKKDLVNLLFDKLPDIMTDVQKVNKVGNIISKMKRNNVIDNNGTTRYPEYVVLKKNE